MTVGTWSGGGRSKAFRRSEADHAGIWNCQPSAARSPRRLNLAATRRATDHADFTDFIRVISVIPAAAGKLRFLRRRAKENLRGARRFGRFVAQDAGAVMTSHAKLNGEKENPP